MAQNPIQFQKVLSLHGFLKEYGTEAQCEQALEGVALAGGLHLPELRLSARTGAFAHAGTLAVPPLPPSSLADGRQHL